MGYDESRRFAVDEDDAFSTERPKYLMKYWTITAVETPDQRVLEKSEGKRLFESEKDGYYYFCVSYLYEHYVWGPSEKDSNMVTTTAKYWVYGLNRYKMVVPKSRTEPNKSVQTTAMTPPPSTTRGAPLSDL